MRTIGVVLLSLAWLLSSSRAIAAWPFDGLFPTAEPTQAAPPRVAVARLEVPANLIIPIIVRVETSFLHDALIAALVRTRTVDVVERTRIDKLLDEQGLTKTGVTDPAQAAALGKVLGASTFAVGTLRDLELRESDKPPLPYTTRAERVLVGRVRFDFRMFDVQTSRVLEADTIDARQERTVSAAGSNAEALRELWDSVQQEAAARFAARIVDTLMPLTIVSVQGHRAELSRGMASGVREGLACDVIGAEEIPVAELAVSNATESRAAGELGGDPALVRPGMVCRIRPPAPPAPPPARTDPLQNLW